jgi:hypothetical protein
MSKENKDQLPLVLKELREIKSELLKGDITKEQRSEVIKTILKMSRSLTKYTTTIKKAEIKAEADKDHRASMKTAMKAFEKATKAAKAAEEKRR